LIDKIQARLLRLAALFITLTALAITFSPAVRLRAWPVDLHWTHWIGVLVWTGTISLLHRQTAISLPERDPYLLPTGALLTGWGILSIFRLDTTLGLRQSAWLLIAGILLLLVLRRKPSLSLLRHYKYLILTGGLILTSLTFVFGTNPLGYGPRLWLGCCGIYFQPSEPLKLFLIIFLSAYVADRQVMLKTLVRRPGTNPLGHLADLIPVLAPSLLMTGFAMTMMVIQRDLGTASIFLFLFTSIIYLSIQNIWVQGLSVISLIASTVSGYLLFDVIRLRVDSWLNPWLDPSDRSYQIVQSLMATANGGLFGRGPGLGNPGLVPIAHSDFIFTAISEELGLIGGIGLIALIAILTHRGMVTALRTTDPFKRFLAVGLTAYLAGQSILIIGGNLRVFPLTGVTLPFVSYGGSSLVTSMLALLALLMISNQVEETNQRLLISRPYRDLHLLFLSGLVGISLALGWWSIYRGPGLLTRTDNARRTIADRFVKRGGIYDRQGQPITLTTGESGSYKREYLYTDLATTIGYTHPIYGQSGLEAAVDPWLRGLEGYPEMVLWWEWIRYGQPPTGLDIRLTIDLQYQKIADELLAGQTGAAVVMNAANGDLLAMSSQPSFDPNQLDQDWSALVQDNAAPLVNRITAGKYPVGAALTPLLLARIYQSQPEVNPAIEVDYLLESGSLNCAVPVSPVSAPRLASQAAAGCPGLTAALGDMVGAAELFTFFGELGLYTAPDIGLITWTSPMPDGFQDAGSAALGLEPALHLSPLQVATAAAALSSNGNRPTPRLIMAINSPNQGWVSQQPSDSIYPVLDPIAIGQATQTLRIEQTLFWQGVANSANEGRHEPAFTWYMGGTLPDWPGRPLVVVVLLEANEPELAIQIGQSLLFAEISSSSTGVP
jgi:cell division protein FtsW (lipid II flippase)